ncbi:MAG: tetratricopeptide repeat protein, partial [Abditibacteriota bacterium]|nr:tetratricopeptide repeat protein [Abditibacteriota bacterium]
CYKDDKNIDGAIGIYENIVKNNPKDSNVRRQLINLYTEKGDYAAAVPHYEVFSKQMATEKKLRSGYAEALEKTGRKDDAVKQYELLMKEDPASAKEKKEQIEAIRWK